MNQTRDANLDKLHPTIEKILNDLPWLGFESVDVFIEDAVRLRIEKLLPLK